LWEVPEKYLKDLTRAGPKAGPRTFP
jgi:hypothetical protein